MGTSTALSTTKTASNPRLAMMRVARDRPGQAECWPLHRLACSLQPSPYAACLVPLVPPRWANARSWISSIPLLVSSLTQLLLYRKRWRRAPLGRSSSQCHLQESEAHLPVRALTALNTKLVKKSAMPIGQQEAVQHRRWGRPEPNHLHMVPPGQRLQG